MIERSSGKMNEVSTRLFKVGFESRDWWLSKLWIVRSTYAHSGDYSLLLACAAQAQSRVEGVVAARSKRPCMDYSMAVGGGHWEHT